MAFVLPAGQPEPAGQEGQPGATPTSPAPIQPGTTAPALYRPPTGEDRLEWYARSTFGLKSLVMAGPISAGWGTLHNDPVEYGPHWEGFGKRYAIRLSGVATNNALEAGLGAIWGEDPRYDRAEGKPLQQRIGHVIRSVYTARGRDGRYRVAYARLIGVAGGNVISNAWRVESERRAGSTILRPPMGLLSRLASNTLAEFWPDIRKRAFKK